ncbi:TipJ family phage tail tip protein [Providencia huaxiensis]|uniref:TipJ family phage tail tip protein n=1 Tax=Providencia huaxiensis TaxID=2027290 RepID=UPI0034DCEB40
MRIQGAKGGSSKPRTPVEQKDSLLSESTAKILLALSEGEIAGGLDDTRIFLDDTPIANADGSKNFEGVTWEFRAGTEHQEYIQGIPSVDNEFSVGMELKDDQPYVRTINNLQLSALRIRLAVPQFMQQHDNGDTTGYRVDYVIELSTDGAGYKEVVKSAFDGKTTSEYQRTHRVDLPKANTGWQVHVRRLTKNQNNARIADRINVAAVAEVIDAKLRYPNTALLFITFNARQFNNRIPKISVRPKGGILVKVPTNYDPINRTYSGVWDGTFKLAVTNNPAWVFYDLVLNNRYGCGDRIKASQVEKWDLYKIAQYCDELVPDGHGGDGKEPRFLCDVYIQSQEAAYTVLRDIAAIFRGMTYWSDNKVNAIADMPSTIFRTFTNANIVGGKPSYSGGSIQNRYTQALVSFTNIDNHSNDDVEPIADLKLQRRYGVRKLELSAIGCTRRTEANRRGRWALLTNANDRMISFATGLEGAIPSPGHIIAVADSSLAGRNTGGRISSVEGRKVTLDRTTSIKAGDRLIVNLPNGGSEGRTVTAVNKKVVTVSVEYSQVPQKEAVWVVDSDDLAIQLYRVINISDNGDNTYTINGTIHNPDNYDHIDSGARIDERPITVIPPNVQPAPKNVRISSYSQVDQGIAFTTLRVDWEAAESAIAYEAEWRRDNGNWINAPRTSTLGFEVNGIYAGRYQVRVRAINASEISSVWASAEETQLNGKEGNPPKPLNLRATSEVWGITLDWGFDVNTSDSLKTELQYSPENTADSMQLLADVPYPLKSYRMSGLKAGARFYFRARLVDKSGNQSEWTSFVLGESSTDVEGILDAVGDKFLSNEAGQRMESRIEDIEEEQVNIKHDIVDVDSKTIELDNKVLNLNTDLAIVNETALQNQIYATKLSYEFKRETVRTEGKIFRLEEVNAQQDAAAARFQEQISARVDYNTSAILRVEHAQVTLEEATAEKINQVTAEVDAAKGRITTVEKTTATLEKAQAEFKQTTIAEFGDIYGAITRMEIANTNKEIAQAETAMQTIASFSKMTDRLRTSEASILRNEKAIATADKAIAETGVQLKAHIDDTAANITDIKKVQVEQDKALAQTREQLTADIKAGDDQLKEDIDKQGRELSDVSSVVDSQKTAIANLEETATETKENQQSIYEEMHANFAQVRKTQADQALSQAESTSQTTAEVNKVRNDNRKIKAQVERTEDVTATLEKAQAKLSEKVSALNEETEAAFVRVTESIAEKDKAQTQHTEQTRAELQKNIDEKGQQIDEQGKVIDKQGKDLSNVSSAVTKNANAIADTNKTVAENEEKTSSRFEGNEADIAHMQKTETDKESSQAETLLQLAVQNMKQGNDARVIKASIIETNKLIATNEKAHAEKFTQLNAQYEQSNARFTRIEKAISDNENAQAAANELIHSEIKDTKAEIEKRAETSVDHKGNASSVFSIKSAVMLNGQYHEAQMMIGAIVKNGKVTTQIGFSADTFGIFNPSSGKLEPAFMVVNGQVVINEAFINKAVIGSIVVQTDMRSPDYVPGKSGMRIDMQNGVFETNSNDGDYSVIRNSKGNYFKYKGVYIMEQGWFL